MPRDYEAIRDKEKAKGMSDRAAKEKAAKIANARRRDEGRPPMKAHQPKGGLGRRG